MEQKIRLFYINKSEYKTSYATAIVDRFIRTIKDKLERYQKLNDTKNMIQAVKDIFEGFNNTEHRMLKKSPNEMTQEDVQKNVQEKRLHSAEVMQDFIEKSEGKTVGIPNRKNIFDKGSKIKLVKDSHEVVETEGYNIKLDNGKSFPPKDRAILK